MSRRAALLRVGGLVLVIGVLLAIALTVGIPSPTQLRARFAGLGPWTVPAFVAVYAVATLSPAPKSVFTVVAGVLFGLPEGVALVVGAATLGSMAAFGVGRVLGRDAVHRLTGIRADWFDEQFGRRGLWAVLAARLVPVVPFTAVNYLAGLTSLQPRVFVLGTAVGILPATTAYVAIGTYGGHVGSWPVWAAIGGLVTLSTVGVGWRRRARAAAMASRQVSPTAGGDAGPPAVR